MAVAREGAAFTFGRRQEFMPQPESARSTPQATQEQARVCEAAARAGGALLREWVGRFGVSTKGPRDLVTEADLASQREIRRITLEAFPDHGFLGEETLEDAPPAAEAGSPCWIVDPLDGTTNYVHGLPCYCVSVALAVDDEILVGAIYDPVSGECFTAKAGGGAWLDGRRIRVSDATEPIESLVAVSIPAQADAQSLAVADFLAILNGVHSIRRSGSSALNLAYLACGRIDAFWARRIAAWDIAAGLLLVREAGGVTAPLRRPGESPAEAGETIPLDSPAFIAAASPQLLVAIRDMLSPDPRTVPGPSGRKV
jgi:myo-inositol-1(or 4)-monophosphatase